MKKLFLLTAISLASLSAFASDFSLPQACHDTDKPTRIDERVINEDIKEVLVPGAQVLSWNTIYSGIPVYAHEVTCSLTSVRFSHIGRYLDGTITTNFQGKMQRVEFANDKRNSISTSWSIETING